MPEHDPDSSESTGSDSSSSDPQDVGEVEMGEVEVGEVEVGELPEPVDPEVAAQMAAERRKKGGGGGGGAILGAAMLAVGDILEPEKTNVEIVQHDDDPLGDPDGLMDGVDFGNLPPLDELA